MAKAEKGISASEIIARIKNREFAPIYFLQGEEPYFIDLVADYIEKNILSEADKGFNQTVFYGKEADFATIMSAARRYPMMAERQVIIVKEAQSLKEAKKLAELLLPYAENPTPSTVLVFCYKYAKLDGRSKAAKVLKDKHIFLESNPVYESQLPAYIEGIAQSLGLKISKDACNLVAENLGSDLSKIANELGKLKLNLQGKAEIAFDDVKNNISVSREFNLFELPQLLATRNANKAYKLVNLFSQSKESIIPLVSILFNFFSKLLVLSKLNITSTNEIQSQLGVNYYQANDLMAAKRNFNYNQLVYILERLHQADKKSKGLGASSDLTDGELLKELVFEILHS